MTEQFNYQIPPVGFGSYLQDILPDDIAIAAGAFAASMQQIKNIKNVEFEEFAQTTASIESVNKNLNLINGTEVPTNRILADEALNILTSGTGPYGTYTTSDAFGCMSGLPYSWQELENNISKLESRKLKNIYNQLFLTTTWEPAAVSVQYTTNPGPTYTITGVTVVDSGGGYGRGGATAPIISIAGGSGATAVANIGMDQLDPGSNGTGTFGRVTTVMLTSPGITTNIIPTATIECPPTATLPVGINGEISNSGVNTPPGTSAWPGLNSVVDAYTTQANLEIQDIVTNNPSLAKIVNAIYNLSGNQLMIEQRTRYNAIAPVPVDYDPFLNPYISTILGFTDMIGAVAKNTYPHMYSQTLEAISDLSTVGGQSIIGLMRQERNSTRLNEIGIELDTAIPDSIDENMCPVLISNNTVPVANIGIEISGINGSKNDPITSYTIPAVLVQEINGQKIGPTPVGYYNPNTNDYIIANSISDSQVGPIQSILKVESQSINNTSLLGPYNNGTGPANPLMTISSTDASEIQSGVTDAGVNGITENSIQPIIVLAATGRTLTDNGKILDTGKPDFLGSMAGSPASNIVPCTLNSVFTSTVLLPNQLSVEEAIDTVIKCNCTCWVD